MSEKEGRVWGKTGSSQSLRRHGLAQQPGAYS